MLNFLFPVEHSAGPMKDDYTHAFTFKSVLF